MMWNWLSKIDPTVVVPMVTGIVGWLWHKARGDKRENFSKVITGVFYNLAEELLDRYSNEDISTYLKTARVFIEERVWKVLAKRGVPRNKTTENLAHGATEEVTAWLAAEVRKLKAGKR